MSIVRQTRRLAALGARTQRGDLAPLIAFLAERHGIMGAEVITEANRIVRLTAGMTGRQRHEWLANETGATLKVIRGRSRAGRAEWDAAFVWQRERVES